MFHRDAELFGFARHLLSRRLATLGTTQRPPRPFSRVIAVSIGPNPTYDYYLAPRFRQFPGLEIIVTGLEPPAFDEALFRDALIFFVRYTSPAWLDLIERHRDVIAGTALLLDDDLDALARDSTIRLELRRRFYRRGVALWPRLSEALDLLFVSTPVLTSRFAAAAPRLLPPVGDDADLPGSAPRRARLTIAYHGTRSHRGEGRWLLPVAEQLLAADPNIALDVVTADPRTSPWRHVKGVTLVAPRPWPIYRQELRDRPLDIMLAPLLPSQLNAARAPTKRIDAARSRAALIVSNREIYAPSREERALGMLVELDPTLWFRALNDLIHDRDRIEALARLNLEHVVAMQQSQRPFLVRDGNFWRFHAP